MSLKGEIHLVAGSWCAKISIFGESCFSWLSNAVLQGLEGTLSDMNPCRLFIGFLTEDCLSLHCVRRVCQCFHINPTAWHPPELRALTTYVTVTSIVSQCRLPLQETLDSFQTAKSVTKHVSWWICLAPKKKSQISCRYPPTEVSESLAPSPFKKPNPSLPEKLEARQLAGAGCKSGRSGPWLISPGKTFSIICVTLTLEQKHDPIPRVARSDR